MGVVEQSAFPDGGVSRGQPVVTSADGANADVVAILRVTRETAPRSPDCAPSLRRAIPIFCADSAESRVQSV